MEKIKVGIFGAGRGGHTAKNFMLQGCEIVAICDANKQTRDEAMAKFDASVKAFENFDDFIQEKMDIVILANFFHEHAPYAIRCLEKGIHVYCECASNGTMAEGVELIRAAEKSDAIYFLAENYPSMISNREIKRVCDGGTLGKILYAEGEYNHPVPIPYSDEKNLKHWRLYTPITYYITHSLGPVMWMTGAMPKKVTAFACYEPPAENQPWGSPVADRAAIITTQNDDGSIFRVTGCGTFGGHHNSYRVCGTEGQIENLRGMGNKIMLRYNEWSKPEGMEEVNCYEPELNDKDADLIKHGGHGGGDYLTARLFLECVREKKQPESPFNVYAAVTMASVAILGFRSIMEGGKPYDIPDFTKEEWRVMYENDHMTPYYGTDGSEPNMPCCSHPDFRPSEKQLALYKKEVMGLE